MLVVLAGCGDSGGRDSDSAFTSVPVTASMGAETTVGATGEDPTSTGPTSLSGATEATSGDPVTTGDASSGGEASSGAGPGCGDGDVDPGEDCDDGNDVETDACTSACVAAACGDGLVQAGVEACDDGNAVETDACTSACVAAVCGDGILQQGVEGCDDGNEVDDDACSNGCALPGCGDGIKQPAEACDDGNMVDTDACTGMCQAASCGDGFIQAMVETCDDKGESKLCDKDCSAATCGDGLVNMAAGEVCDDGNMVDTDACLGTCVAAKCGDGKIQAGVEDCDDGNVNPNDGCSAMCKKEVAAACLNNPKWTPVTCTTPKWMWSSDKGQAMTLADANSKKLLWSGCSHAPYADTCSLDGKGWVSTMEYVMAGCNATWYHIGGEYTGNCGGHDGDKVRRLALTQNDCYDY